MDQITNYGVRVSADGKIVSLDITRNGNKSSVDIDADTIGAVVAGLLSGAIESALRSGAKGSPLVKKEALSAPPFAVANGVGLFELQTQPNEPKLIGLGASFGQTVVGLGLPYQLARRLGEGLLVATADETKNRQ